MLYNDISNDYKMRDYVVQYTIQKNEFIGHIYVRYSSGGFGLSEYEFVDFQTIHTFGYIENDCDFKVCDNETKVKFNLADANGNKIEIFENVENLSKYLVGINIISCKGHGKKKETRKCFSCKNFKPIPNTKKGRCLKRKDLDFIYGCKIICAFEYEEIRLI